MRSPHLLRRVLTSAGAAAAALGLAACAQGAAASHRSSTPTSATPASELSTHHHLVHHHLVVPTTTAPSTTSTTTTTIPPTTTSTLPPLGAASPGLVKGRVTVVGDSVTVDAQSNLQQDIPGVDVEAAVSQQWYQGVAEIQTLRSEGRLGAIIVVALGTNGPISQSLLAQMMQACQGASRVVFVTDHVPLSWQDPNDAILRAAPSEYRDAVVADWEALAAQHPSWFYSDGVHMPIGGTGAAAMASLIASKV